MSDLVALTMPHQGVALVTFGDPTINNNLSWAGAGSIAAALRDAREAGARVTVVASSTPGHWLEHAWLTDLVASVKGEPTTGPGRGFYDCLRELLDPEVISIAAIDGDTSGGGCELGWAHDLRVASRGARFAQPEILLGIPTGIGGTARLGRLIGPTVAAEMIYDGRPVTAGRLHALGAVNRLVPDGEATIEAVDWAAQLATRSPAALTAIKRSLLATMEMPLTDALRYEQENFQTVVGNPDAVAQMQATQDKLDAGASFRELYGDPAD